MDTLYNKNQVPKFCMSEAGIDVTTHLASYFTCVCSYVTFLYPPLLTQFYVRNLLSRDTDMTAQL
jgi:hypothetical protein